MKEAGLDNEEEENNGEDSDSLNNPITIYYCLAHLPRPLRSFRVYSLGYFLECVYGFCCAFVLSSTCFRIISGLMSMLVSIDESLSKSHARHMNAIKPKTPFIVTQQPKVLDRIMKHPRRPLSRHYP